MLASDVPSKSEPTRILLVPGSLLGSELGPTYLDRAEFDVREASSFAAAAALADTWEPHLIVLARELRGARAVGFVLALDARPRRITPRLLMITDRVHGALQHDDDDFCDAHLVSPVSRDQLLATIAELCAVRERRSPRAPLDVLVHMEGFADDGTPVDGALATGVDVNEEGMLIEASRQLGMAARGRLYFFLPGQPERLSLDARVRIAVNEVRLLYVVEFLDLAPQHRALIRRYVESQREAA